MSAIGPVTLEEARNILAERLRTLDEQPPANRFGCVFVGTPQQLRGRVFKVVFVPSLAERLFPQTPREDPMLLDVEMRTPLGAGLFVQEDRLKNERLMLRLAVGAATSRLWLSYPRLDVSGARPRVPSFYMLDVMRAVTGKIPNHEALQRDAAQQGGARLDWPAPADAAQAIDEVEHDLSTLRELIGHPDRASGARTRPLPARTQRFTAAFSDSPLGPRAVALARAGWPRRPERRDQADAGDAAAGRAAVLGVRAAEVHAVPVSVRAVGDLPARSRIRSPSRCSASTR